MTLSLSLPLARPPWKKLGKKLESATRKALFDYKMVEGTSKIAIALSGGKDSLTLLFFLHAISGKGFPKFELACFFVGGPFSCGAQIEENFLKKICDALDIPFFALQASSKEPSECYSCSRERRRLIFNAAKEKGFETIAFGHHRDDNAQTLLLNLFHKGEFSGMQPKIKMIDYDVTIIRPLIYLSETDIKNFAKEYGFLKITCQCPIGQNSMRKKVDRLLNDLEDLFPNVRQNASSASLKFGSKKALFFPEDR